MTQTLLGFAAAALLLALRTPAFALLPLLLVELSVANEPVPGLGFSARIAVVLGATLLAWRTVVRGVRASGGALARVALPALGLIALATIVNLMYEDADYSSKYLRFQLAQFLVLVLTATVLRDERDARAVGLCALALGAVTAGAAVWQVFARSSALYGAGSPKDIAEFSGRVIGLSTSPVQLSKHLVFLLVFLLGLLSSIRLRLSPGPLLLVAAAALLASGLYFTQTRSALLALGMGLLAIALLITGPRRLLIVGAIAAAGALFAMGLFGARYYRDADTDRSAAGHQALWKVGFVMALDQGWTGIGHLRFEELSTQYLDAIETEDVTVDDQASGARAVGKQRPHNDFLNVWISWGILALGLYLALIVGTIRNYLAAAERPSPLVRGLAIGGAAGLVAYAFDSAFHNSLDTSIWLWAHAGLSVGLLRLDIYGGPAIQRLLRPRAASSHGGRSTPPRHRRTRHAGGPRGASGPWRSIALEAVQNVGSGHAR
ncbi:MAG TPA: O-antigen ligase family protein [Chloroflexota bacterium]|nr:O-antigen ligase family protein [Chloroflexota bacterium]